MRAQTIGALARAAGGFTRTLARVVRQVFHETTAALFFLFAVVGALTAWREWHKGAAQWLVGLAVAFTLMMVGFAVASFRSARRVR